MRIPQDLQELIDKTAQDSGTTRQKKLAEIIEFYFSDRGEQERGAAPRGGAGVHYV
jgi:predicted DNA-binding protein